MLATWPKLTFNWSNLNRHPNMAEIGAYEAKTNLAKLLNRVARGERFTITKHGHPVAELIPVVERDRDKILAAIESLKRVQAKRSLRGLSVRKLVAAGRRA